MPLPIGWETDEELNGENDPMGREDTANKYARRLWTNFIVGHNKNDGSHKTGGLCQMEEGEYTSQTGDKVVSLSDSNAQILCLKIYGDVAQYPVIASVEMSANETKEFGTATFQGNQIKDIFTLGQFTVGTDDTVNAQGSTETYFYTVWYIA